MLFDIRYEEEEIIERCWNMIDTETEAILETETFSRLDRPTLQSILHRNTLYVKERSVFDAMVRWARLECENKEVESNAENIR